MTDFAQTSPILTLAPSSPRRLSMSAVWQFWRRRANPAVTLSVIVLLVLIVSVLLADVIAPHDPGTINLRGRLMQPFQDPAYILGTDATGRDIFSRILYGGQVSLAVSLFASIGGLLLGTILGLVSGYTRGLVSEIIMYLVDVQLALPFLLLAVSVALVLGTSITVLIGLAALSTWPIYARVVRSSVLSLREREFVVAAQAVGASTIHIMRFHLFPNLVAPLVVLVMLNVGRIILLESGLSFLGIGVQPPTPSWGIMINEGREYLSSAWWLSIMPGIILILLTMAVGTIGDWLRDLMDVSLS
ncbi:MAG: ABC transporter permease [Pleurocapsa minor GSE-CHR-MK-17-07R]|nr:ABC transporter permease [Pleurocapsa minor GSE-CHR-MK 17-07R]